MEGLNVMEASETLCENGPVQLIDDVKENGDVGDGLLEDLESYLQDINDRLTISRMVNDSIIKGMVNAVAEETAEKIAEKELELAELNGTLHLYHVGAEKDEFSGSLLMCELICKHGVYHGTSQASVEHDKAEEYLGSLRHVAKEQFLKIRKEVDCIRGCNSIRRVNSGSEMVGLSGILQEKVCEKWNVDIAVDDLEATVDTIYERVEDIVQLSKASICQWQDEQKFQADIESMVIMNCIQSLQEVFGERLWKLNAQFYDDRTVTCIENVKEISKLRKELNTIYRSLTFPEFGQLISHNSLEADHMHCKVLSNRGSVSALPWEGNGKHEESKIKQLDNLDSFHLNHLSNDELINHFNLKITMMKREHESQIQDITEENFALKGELLRSGSSSSLKKDKEFDILKKRIPDILLKLDDILVENEKLPAFCNDVENVNSLRDRLLSENRNLRDVLEEKTKEVKCLSSQVLNDAEKMSQHALLLENSLKEIENQKFAMQDAHIEAFINEEVYKCLLREIKGQVTCIAEESVLGYIIMQEFYDIIIQESAHSTEAFGKLELEDSDIECIMMQVILGDVLGEASKEAKEKMDGLNKRYIDENEVRVSLEMEAMENKRALRAEVEEKQRLKEKLRSLQVSIEKQEWLLKEAVDALEKEKEKLVSASQELTHLRDQTSQQQILILGSNRESNAIKGNLAEASEIIERLKVESFELNQKFEQAKQNLRDINEEKRMLLAMAEEYQNFQSMVEAKETEYRKQIETMIVFALGLSKEIAEFERSVKDHILGNTVRLEILCSQSRLLIQSASTLRRTGLAYKQRFERRCSDLQKAEAEVDLLGDEVEALLNLLEKTYIGLYHYSPILQHYPGIIEILKLVKRELIGDSTQAVESVV